MSHGLTGPSSSIILSAHDPDAPSSSYVCESWLGGRLGVGGGLVGGLVGGLGICQESLQLSSKMSGSPPFAASTMSPVWIRRTLLHSSRCEQCLPGRDVNT